jgi:hypothetical protein
MKKMLNINGIPIEVVPDQTVIDSQAPMMVVRLEDAHKPLDEYYIPGTVAGYYCSVCSQECILAPSGQAIHSVGKNPLVCYRCLFAMKGESQ